MNPTENPFPLPVVSQLQKLHAFLLADPGRVVSWGFKLGLAGLALLAAGLLGRLFLIVTADPHHASTTARTLDPALPYLPTWWIPETWFGYFAALMMAAMGVAMYAVGRKLMALLDPPPPA